MTAHRGQAAACLGLLAVALAACRATVDPGPDYERASALVAEATGTAGLAVPDEDDEGRRQRIEVALADGLTVGEAVQVALWNDPDLAAHVRAIGVAHAARVQAGLLANPFLGVAFRLPSGGGRTEIEGELVQQLADLWRLPARRGAAQRELERAVLLVARTAVERATAVQRAYFDAVASAEAVDVARANVAVARALLDAALARQEAGAGSQLDANVAQAELRERELVLRDAELARAQALRDVALRLGLSARPGELELTDGLGDEVDVPAEGEPLLAVALETRLDLAAAEEAVLAAEQRLALERDQRWRGVEAGVAFERGDETLVGPAVGIELPLFDGNEARIAAAAERLGQARASQAAARLAVVQGVRGAHQRALAALEAARFHRDEILPRREDNLDLSRAAYQEGKASFLVVLEAQRTLLEARSGYLDRRRAAAAARADLEQQVGRPLDALPTPIESAGPVPGGEMP